MTEDSLIGQQLDEYRLEALLGEGGMARVYSGLDVRLKRKAAIKVIAPSFRSDSEYVVRFEREGRVLAQLEHPHIAKIYRYGEANRLLYMAMQYVEGADLGFVLDSYRADDEFMEPADARRIVREICLALDYAHSRGVIHRDIKPSNVMLDRQGCVYLTDFGLALLTELGTRGEILGSPHYMAPEQAISSANAVPQSDLYAVGVILYEMFTGELVFDAENPLDIAALHMTEPPRPPRDLRPEIPPALEAVILRALEKKPEDRYQSGTELADALDEALQGPPAGSPSVPPATIPRLSVLERVTLGQGDHLPPPVPAAVARPAPRKTEPKRAPGLATPFLSGRHPLVYVGLGVSVCLFLAALLAGAFLLSDRAGKATGPTTPVRVRDAMAEDTPTAGAVAASTPTAGGTAGGAPTARATARGAPTTASPQQETATAPGVTETPQATEEVATYALLIATQGDDSLFVVNRGVEPFPLGPLRLGDGKGAVNGAEWGVDTLGNGDCVAVWQDKGKAKSPAGLSCNEIGEHLTRDGKQRFWKEAFDVYYYEEKIAHCSAKGCSITWVRDDGD
jgi:serine/threonine protein kinase